VASGFHGPVYATEATCALLELVQPVPFHQSIPLDGVAATWRPAGHLLGSAFLEVDLGAEAARPRLVFSGDLGRYDSEVMKPPAEIEDCDVLLLESTYGDRVHADQPIAQELSRLLGEVAESKGVLLIPAFAVGRTQQVLYHIRALQEAGLSASGMLTGGRILHHLKWRLPEARNTVLCVGYQAEGTRGRALLEGAKSLRVHGDQVTVRAQIAQVDALSGHAGQDELLRWLGGLRRPPSQVYLVHGEPPASQELERQIGSRLGYRTSIASEGMTVELK